MSGEPKILTDPTGQIAQIRYKPELTLNIGQMFRDAHREYEEQVCDVDAILAVNNDLIEKMKAMIKLKNKPDVIDARIFTPAKKQPMKRLAGSATKSAKQAAPQPKRVKEEPAKTTTTNNNTAESSTGARVLRSRAVTRSLASSLASSSYNSSANTVIEAGSSRGRAQPKGTPIRKAPVPRTPVRTNKAANGDVKLTPAQKKEALLEEKRQVTMRRIEEKEKRQMDKKAEKEKVEILKKIKASTELNKTPVNARVQGTPVGKKFGTPARANRNLNVTPLPGFSNSSNASGLGKATRQGLPKATASSSSIRATPTTSKAPAKPVRAAAAKAPKAPAIKPTASKGKLPVIPKPAKEAPQLQRHIQPAKPAVAQPAPFAALELSPIRLDMPDMPHILPPQIDFSMNIRPIQFDTINDSFNPAAVHKQNIASTFLEETFNVPAVGQSFIVPKAPAAQALAVNETYNQEEKENNNYDITKYMSESQMDMDQEYRNGKKIPRWARGKDIREAIAEQFGEDAPNPTAFFPEIKQFIPTAAFEGLDATRYLNRLDNRDESLAWNVHNL